MPDVVIHCDWSLNRKKRFMAHASKRPDDWLVHATQPVPAEPIDLFSLWPDEKIFLGLDLPLGVPLAWADQVGIDSFNTLLDQLAESKPPWERFFDVAESASEISPHRPFYPRRPGGTQLQHLVDGLNLDDRSALRRLCDRPTEKRGAAAPLFWTMGAQQVGKAALSCWESLVIPLKSGAFDCALWPFDGPLGRLRSAHKVVVAEVYPAEMYGHIGIEFPIFNGRRTGKRSQPARLSNASRLLSLTQRLSITFDGAAQAEIEAGFGSEADGEDRFDAMIGLLGMLLVLDGQLPEGYPADDRTRFIEGWLLGMSTKI